LIDGEAMTERKIKVPGKDGKMVDAIDVPIEQAIERWSELTLEDGTVVRAKMSIASIARVEGQYDPHGNPLYLANSSPIISIVSVPDRLKKKDQ
jgi:hypothetical protein